MTLKIGIIVGSTRPGRKADAVARWVHELANKRHDAEFEVVDIQDFQLPLLDEPLPPSLGQYREQHTKVWAAKIWILWVGGVVGACGARSTILDGPADPTDGTGAGAATGSTSSGPFAVTSAGSGEVSGGEGASASTSGGPGAGTSTGTGVVPCQSGGPGQPLDSACSAYACELTNSGNSDCGACLNEAVLTTCAYEIHRATSHHHHCGDANECAESCGGAGLCDCIVGCMEDASHSNQCAHRWADAFWCISGACASACGG